MQITLRRLQLTYSRSVRNWQTFLALVRCMHRRAELVRLIQWATRKRLPGPARCYQRRLPFEEERLATYTIREPGLAACARIAYHWWSHLNPPKRYPHQGSAAGYRRTAA